jgi:uncharacterized protein YqjF (DUF2071 family)
MLSAEPEPVTPHAPDRLGPTLLTQSWLELTLVHWALDPGLVAPRLPPGIRPDVIDGVTYVGLVAFRMHRIGWWGMPGIPYFGTFPETNVRLYSVDDRGRRGVVFLTLEASRLAPVVVARLGFGLPYQWARMSIRRDSDTVRYVSRRRRSGVGSRITVRIGESVAEPSALEHFLTARWGLHNAVFGRTVYLPNEHPPWALHRAQLVECQEDLLAAVGLGQVAESQPVSVLYSPGVPVRFGRPT